MKTRLLTARFLPLAIIPMLNAASSGDGDWPQFRGPTGQGLSAAINVPVNWSATSNVAWKTSIPGEGWSSPILGDGRVYVTAAVEEANGVSLRAICVDAGTGAILWNVEALKGALDQARIIHQKNSLASPTPVLHESRLYAHFGHMGTAALDLSGKVLWRQTSLSYPPLHGNGGSPALIDGLVVVNCDGSSNPFMAAMAANTGQVRWKTPRNTPAKNTFSFSTPLAIQVDGRLQIVSACSGLVAGYDPASGRELWRVRYGDGFSVVPRPVFSHGLIFLSSGFMQPVIYCINPAGAQGDVTDSRVVWTHRKGGPNTPSLLVAGNELYFVSDGGIASCLDARTGKVHWSERLGGNFSASPVLADDRLYFPNESGVVYVVKAATTFEVLATNDLQERMLASPAVTDNALILRSEKHLWRIGSRAAARAQLSAPREQKNR